MLVKIGNICLILAVIGFLLSMLAGVAGGVETILSPYGGWVAAPLAIKAGVIGVVTMAVGVIGLVCCMILESKIVRD